MIIIVVYKILISSEGFADEDIADLCSELSKMNNLAFFYLNLEGTKSTLSHSARVAIQDLTTQTQTRSKIAIYYDPQE